VFRAGFAWFARDFPSRPGSELFAACFTGDKPVLICYGGHASALESLLFHRPMPGRFKVVGFKVGAGTILSFRCD